MATKALEDSQAQIAARFAEQVEAGFEDGDGIVALPVTPRRLAAAVAASGQDPDAVLGAFAGGPPVRIRDLAQIAMSAGCEPRYMPLIVAAVEAMLEQGFPAELLLNSGNGYFPYVVVNGPIRHELGLNCRPNVFGPGFRANATIGRALHLVLMHLGGSRPGDATIGNAYKFTCVVGEDEENSPWPPVSTTFSFQAGENIVTVMVGMRTQVLSHQLSREPEHLLRTYAEEVSTVANFNPLDVAVAQGGYAPKAVLALANDHRGYFEGAGWDRPRMQAFLHDVARRSAADVRAAGHASDPRLAGAAADAEIPIFSGPEDFIIISAGSGGGRAMIGTAAFSTARRIAPPASPKVDAAAAPLDPLDEYIDAAEQFIDRKMTDGWPIVPPDAQGIAAFVTASNLPSTFELGVAPWRSGPVTVRDLAINAQMVGCRPDYMPLLCTIYQMLFGEDWAMGMAASTMGYNGWYVIHGPIARELGINSGGGLFGPGARANVTIGRAIRVGMMNLAGLKPDLVDRSCLGQAFKYGAVIAEDERGSLWGPLHGMAGLSADQSAVSMVWGAHPRVTFNSEASTPEQLLRSIADDLVPITSVDSPSARGPAGGSLGTSQEDPGAWMKSRGRLIVLGKGHQAILRDAGWTRRQAQEFLYERCHRTVGDIRRKGFETSPFIRPEQGDEERIALVSAPEKFHILCAGGEGGVSISVSALPRIRAVGPDAATLRY